MPRLLSTLLCVLACFVVGCATRSDVDGAKVDIIRNDNDNRQLLSAEHIKMMAGDIDGLKTQIADAKHQDELFQAQLNAQHEQIAQKGIGLERVAAIVDQSLGSLAQGKGPIQVAIEAAAGLAKSGAIEKSQALTDAEAQKRELAAKSLDDSIKKVDQQSQDRTEAVKKELASLSKDTFDRISKLSQDSQDTLKKAGEQGPDQLRQAFLAEFSKVGVAKTDLDKVKGMSPEALYALLALVLGGGAAGGKALSSMGKSRASGEISGLETRMAEMEVATGRDSKTAKPYLDELFERVEALDKKVSLVAEKDCCGELSKRITAIEGRLPAAAPTPK